MIKYGVDKLTDELVYIDNAVRGLSCNCKCLECGRDLIANKGDINEWYFDHYVRSFCTGGGESAIHRLTKEIILKHSKIFTPYGPIEYSSARSEVDLGFLCPDIAIVSGGKNIFIEIFFRNKKKKKQIELFVSHKLKSFEIDISKVPLDISPQELEYLLLENLDNRKVLYWDAVEEQLSLQYPNQDESLKSKLVQFFNAYPLLAIGFFIAGIFLLYRIFFSRNGLIRRSL